MTIYMEKKRVVDALNRALASEYAAVVQFLTHASLSEGLDADPLRSVLRDMARHEVDHAEQLLQRIWALRGSPAMQVAKPSPAKSVREILNSSIRKEEEAMAMYREILAMVSREEDLALYETVEHILADEQEDLERLTRLKGR